MNRLKDYDTMKGITILLVVFAHVTRSFRPQAIVPIMHSSTLEHLTNFIYVFHMPAFVAVAGAVYYFIKREKNRYNDSLKFSINKAKRLLVPFFFFSFITVLPVLYYLNLIENVIKFVILEVFLGMSSTHLWYSVMIFGVFILFNFFEEWVFRNREWLNWLVFIMFFIFSFFVPGILQTSNILRYSIYFYAGYWFQKNKKEKYLINRAFVIHTAVTVAAYFILFHSTFGSNGFFNIGLQLIGGLSGTAMLYVVSNKFSHSDITKSAFFIEITDSSYGIYLFHPMIIYLISFWQQGTNLNPYLLAIFNFIVTLFLSIFFVRLMRRMNLQVLIGESNPKTKQIKGNLV